MNSVVNKNGQDVQNLIAQVAKHETPVVIVALPWEQPGFLKPFLEAHEAQVAQGIAKAAVACGDAEVLVYTADKKMGEGLVAAIKQAEPDVAASVILGEASPVTREESALYAAMQGMPVRSELMDKAYPEQGWENRPTLLLDIETAYWLQGQAGDEPQGKFVAAASMQNPEEVKLEKFLLGMPLSEVSVNFGLADEKALLMGGIMGQFANCAALDSETLAYTRDFDTMNGFGDSFCMAQVAQKLTEDIEASSCGKCVLCREGSWQLKALFADITAGRGKKGDLDIPADIGPLIQAGAFCQYGKDMVRPAMSLVELYRPELEAHIVRKNCPAGVCTAFQNYVIDPALCEGCGDCADVCPEDAIEGKPGYIHMIDEALCEKCGKCAEVCEAKAIVIATGRIKVPKKLTRVGRFK